MRDLERIGRDVVSDALPQDGTIDIEALREEVGDRAHEAADSACIYYHHCLDIISDYESDPRADTDTADDCGGTFKPSQWQEAAQAYAFWIARGVIAAEADAAIDEIEEAIDHLSDALAGLPAPPDADVDDYRLTAQCPHGWAAHDREDSEGACFWTSRQLDGCNAIAVPVAGMWVSYTWTAVERESVA